MTTYAVGDIQGCFGSLMRLLDTIGFSPEHDHLWAVGDLVNRGEDNLSTLRWFYEHRDIVQVVLGNHDLHLIAVASGVRALGKSDNFHDILAAPDAALLIDWLRQQPLLFAADGYVMTHAGIPSIWTIKQAKRYAKEVETALRSDDYQRFLQHMYGNHPQRWSTGLRGMARLRLITNYFTRMRFCTKHGDLDHRNKGPSLEGAANLNGSKLKPWFEHQKPRKQTLLFGHWASLEGRTNRTDVIGLDTGCVWGGALTALNIETGQRFSQC